jgi:hypothetical protein
MKCQRGLPQRLLKHGDTTFRGSTFGPAAHAAGYAFIVALRVSAGTP